jgi:hypothetical protein
MFPWTAQNQIRMQKFPLSILSFNLIPLGDLSSPLKGAFSQEEINSRFFLIFAQK